MKKKILLGLGFVGMLASQVQAAALTVDPLDETSFMNVAGVVVVALASFWAVKAGLRLLRS